MGGAMELSSLSPFTAAIFAATFGMLCGTAALALENPTGAATAETPATPVAAPASPTEPSTAARVKPTPTGTAAQDASAVFSSFNAAFGAPVQPHASSRRVSSTSAGPVVPPMPAA